MKTRFTVLVLAVVALIVAACAQPAAQQQPAPAQQAPAQQPAQKPAEQKPAEQKPAQAPAAQPTQAPAQAPAAKAPAAGVKEFRGAWPYQLPPAGHYNTFVTATAISLGIYWDMLETPLALFNWAEAKFVPALATEWKTEAGDNFTVKLRSGLKWSDGAEITSQDVVTTFTLARLMSQSVWRYIDKVEAPDKTTVRFHFTRPTSVAPRFILRETRIRSHATYKEFGDKAKALFDAGKTVDSDEIKALRKDFEAFRPKEMVTSGPVKIDPASITEAQLTLLKRPDGFASDKLNFDRLIIYNGETPTVTPIALSKELDYATHGFPPATEKAFLDAGTRVVRPPLYSGPALIFNWTNKLLAKPEVRRAMAYAIKRDENGTVSLGKSGIAVKNLTGVSDNMLGNWMSQADIAKLEPYAFDTKKADDILKAAGFTKGSDGVYAGPDGKLEFELTAPAEFADWSASAENAAQQLSNFGIKTTYRGVQFQQHLQDVQQGKFQIAYRGWGAGNPHPFFAYETGLLLFNAPLSPGPGMSLPFKQQVDGKEVDFNDLITKTAAGLDETSQKAAFTELALAFNKNLPVIPLWERYGNSPAPEGVRVAAWPADTDPVWKQAHGNDNPIVFMLLDGRAKPKP